MAKHLLIPPHLSDDFEGEKKAAIKRFYGKDAEALLRAPQSNEVTSAKDGKYQGIITFYFEKHRSTFHYEYSPSRTTGKKFSITKDWND
ncbi:TPA: hypothetical protein ACKPG1_004871 [Pseudomonas aeruginosa]|uniref:hypothetical protein n=1 Tax=Pseudomonas aeruginosa TaxID=287 RepID=UPI0012987C91|nr:hypothetical protein [Pseudomonas aeruginosa]HBN8595378.1 hypothetical protein [Pseudomonas aeruginosa]HBO6098223.1 hypothetical protein [Pseudomonas aeruginosa]HEJ1861505.1 hypothetical protein [Pseudomonas aeruginosa]HEK1363356.1 hypothetical protein [Pseudomonas aeruginosa]